MLLSGSVAEGDRAKPETRLTPPNKKRQGKARTQNKRGIVLEQIIEKIKKETFEALGRRVQDGKCLFCGKSLNGNDWCDCKEAKKKNRFYKRAFNKIDNLAQKINVSLSLDEVKKDYFSYFSTPDIFEGMTFEDYEISGSDKERESQQKGLTTVQLYNKSAVYNFLTGMNLILLGNFGTGKSMLMSILCNALADEYLFQCRYVNAVKFYQKITDSFKNNAKSVKDVITPYKQAEFLFLDDIDKVKPSDYVREIFYDLVNYRTENELPTIISANHSLEELDEKYYGEAIVSRLIQKSKIINFTHKNRRFEA